MFTFDSSISIDRTKRVGGLYAFARRVAVYIFGNANGGFCCCIKMQIIALVIRTILRNEAGVYKYYKSASKNCTFD